MTAACCALHNVCEAGSEYFCIKGILDNYYLLRQFTQPEGVTTNKTGPVTREASEIRNVIYIHIHDTRSNFNEQLIVNAYSVFL